MIFSALLLKENIFVFFRSPIRNRERLYSGAGIWLAIDLNKPTMLARLLIFGNVFADFSED